MCHDLLFAYTLVVKLLLQCSVMLCGGTSFLRFRGLEFWIIELIFFFIFYFLFYTNEEDLFSSHVTVYIEELDSHASSRDPG